MRPLPLALSVVALAACGCSDRTPHLSIESVDLEGQLQIFVFDVPPLATLKVCDVEQKSRKSALVPLECVLPAEMPLDPSGDVDSRPIPVVVKPLFGAERTYEITAKLEMLKQMLLLEGLFGSIARGGKLPRGEEKHAKPGIAFWGYGGVRAIDAKALGDLDVVVRVELVKKRDTGRTCSYTGMTGSLFAYDADLTAFDAHSGEKLGKTHLEDEHPSCPSTNFGKIGDHNTVTSYPPDTKMNAWARTLAPKTGEDG